MDEAPGFAALIVRGEDLDFLRREAGGHRWQRIPPTERQGRVHTSTVTVAVLDADEAGPSVLDPGEVEVSVTRGSGPGGQHRNKVESCVTATHVPTGLSVRIDGRSQFANKRLAMAVLASKVAQAGASSRSEVENTERRGQLGSGMRGDKVRTYRVRDDQIVDHRTGAKFRLAAWMRGEAWDLGR